MSKFISQLKFPSARCFLNNLTCETRSKTLLKSADLFINCIRTKFSENEEVTFHPTFFSKTLLRYHVSYVGISPSYYKYKYIYLNETDTYIQKILNFKIYSDCKLLFCLFCNNLCKNIFFNFVSL